MNKKINLRIILLMGWMSISHSLIHASTTAPSDTVPTLIPRPVSYQRQQGQFLLSPGTHILLSDMPDSEPRLALLIRSLRDFTGLPLPTSMPEQTKYNIIQLAIDPLQVVRPEGYQLLIDPSRIRITGHDSAGLFYGVQSLIQLLHPLNTRFTIAACSITDYPRYPYRGMHLDVCRHFFPVPAIKKWINTLALYKFNTFHWHLTDDQGWRIEIKKYPRLQSIAAWRQETLIGHKKETPHLFDGKRYGGYYTQEEVKEIVQYAAERNITVIPEIEMPGHALAALAAYPTLGCTGGPYKTATFWGVFDDVYCAGNDSVFVFLQQVLDEVMALFPSSYIHIGGDECPKTRWMTCPRCQQRIRENGLKDEHGLQSYFVQRMEKYINAKGRQIIGWDEILEGGLAPGATVMSWRGEEGGLAAARQRHSVILSPESHLYFDYYQSLHPEEQLAAGNYTPLSKVYGYEPLAGSADTAAMKYIKGVEGTLWTEYLSTPAQVEYMWFPRALAVAELGWSPAPAASPTSASSSTSASSPGPAGSQAPPRNYEDFLYRLRAEEKLLKKLNIHYADNFDEIKYNAAPTGAGAISVSLSTSSPAAQIRYTLDNSKPGPQSAVYTGSLILQTADMNEVANTRSATGTTRTITVKAMLYQDLHPIGRMFQKSFQLHTAIGAPVSLLHAPSGRYAAGPETLVNGISGNDRYNDGQWLGFAGDDLEAIIDLGTARTLHRIGINVLNYHWQKMWAPVTVHFFISPDGVKYKEVYTQDRFPINGINRVNHTFPAETARYVKVTGVNKGTIPAGEYGAGGKALLMTDEISID